jgi:hypothetical protein
MYNMKNGKEFTVEYDDNLCIAKAYHIDGTEIGSFQFREIEAGYEVYQSLHITHMGLCIRGQGIGETILRHILDTTDIRSISAGEDDGIPREDGSHLIDGGIGFIKKMREKGLVTPSMIY